MQPSQKLKDGPHTTPSPSQKLKDDAVAAAGGGGVRIEVGEGGGGEDGTPSIVVRIDSHLFGL